MRGNSLVDEIEIQEWASAKERERERERESKREKDIIKERKGRYREKERK